MRRLLARAPLLALPLLACRPAAPAPPACDGTLRDAAFLAGAWQHTHGAHRSEEQWSEPAGGTMLGHGRTIAGTRTDFFEFLRIEARPTGLVYIAQPGGGPPVEFPLSHCGPGELHFTNKAHDFPQQIRYRRAGDNLHTEVAGPGRDGGWQGHEADLRRVP